MPNVIKTLGYLLIIVQVKVSNSLTITFAGTL